MIDDIQNYQLKWNKHVLRMPENRIPRQALQYRPQAKRDLGKTKNASEGRRRGRSELITFNFMKAGYICCHAVPKLL